MAGDWVKLYRDARDHSVFQDEWLWKLWTWCLMRANYAPQQFHGKTIEAGEFVTSMEKAAEMLDRSKVTVWRGLQKLATDDYGCVSLRIIEKVKRKYTVVTINNWTTYQNGSADDETREKRERNAGETRAKQIEERKKERSNTKSAAIAADPAKTQQPVEIPKALDTPQFRQAWSEWLQYRAERKEKATPTGLKRSLINLSGWGPDRAAAAIYHSIANGWRGIFEPKGGENGRPSHANGQSAEQKRFESSIGALQRFADGDADAVRNSDGPPVRLEADDGLF